MPANSPTADAIRELQKDSSVFNQRLVNLESYDVAKVRERVAVLEAEVADLRRTRDESGRRWTQFALIAVGSLFTVAVRLIVRSLGK